MCKTTATYRIQSASCVSGPVRYAEQTDNPTNWRYMTEQEFEALGGNDAELTQEQFDGLSGVRHEEERDMGPVSADVEVELHRAADDGMGAAVGASASEGGITLAQFDGLSEPEKRAQLSTVVSQVVAETLAREDFGEASGLLVFAVTPGSDPNDPDSSSIRTVGKISPKLAYQAFHTYAARSYGIPQQLAAAMGLTLAAWEEMIIETAFSDPAADADSDASGVIEV